MGKEAIAPINASETDVAIRRLEHVRTALPELLDWFRTHPEERELWCFRLFSLEEGLRRLEAFLPEMRRSMQMHAKGQPLGPSSTKTRGSKKILEEQKKTLDAKRSKKKT
jgi:hypothetical protein